MVSIQPFVLGLISHPLFHPSPIYPGLSMTNNLSFYLSPILLSSHLFICLPTIHFPIYPSIHPPQTCLFLVLATCLAWFSASCWEPGICFLKLETPCQYKSLSSQEISGPQECCRFRQDRWLVHCPPSVNLWRFSPFYFLQMCKAALFQKHS